MTETDASGESRRILDGDVLRIFRQLCGIPRGSHDEGRVSAWLADRLRRAGLDVETDEVGNVYARKPASPGREGAIGVVLQSHLDMVCQAERGSAHDFARDPILARPDPADPEWLVAEGTTLGADNGVGVAAMIAILEDRQAVHGPLECLFTTCEEDGMIGARAVGAGKLGGSFLLNLDGEDDGVLTIGCAGTLRTAGRAVFAPVPVPAGRAGVEAVVSGLAGGHSGQDIHKGRGNAAIMLARAIRAGNAAAPSALASFSGGSASNAIPRDATAALAMRAEDAPRWTEAAVREASAYAASLGLDASARFSALPVPAPSEALSDADGARLLECVAFMPDGLRAMEEDFDDVARTSSNLGVCVLSRGGSGLGAEILVLVRSSVESEKQAVGAEVEARFREFGLRAERLAEAPAWQPETGTKLLESASEVHRSLFGKDPGLMTTHGGLECGLFRATYPEWQMISFGPTIRYPHSPSERLWLPSVPRFMDWLRGILERLSRPSA